MEQTRHHGPKYSIGSMGEDVVIKVHWGGPRGGGVHPWWKGAFVGIQKCLPPPPPMNVPKASFTLVLELRAQTCNFQEFDTWSWQAEIQTIENLTDLQAQNILSLFSILRFSRPTLSIAQTSILILIRLSAQNKQ